MRFEPITLMVAVFTLLTGVGSFAWGWWCLRTSRRIARLRPTPIPNVAKGFVEIRGKAKGTGPLLTSPFLKKACLYYHLHVDETELSLDGMERKTVINDKKACDLLVEDANQATIRVNLHTANVMLKPDLHTSSGFLDGASPAAKEVLSQYRVYTKGLLLHRAMRFTESILEAGDEICVLGTAHPHAGGGMIIEKFSDIFIVSDQTKEELAEAFRRKVLIRLLGGGLIGALGVALVALSSALGRVE